MRRTFLTGSILLASILIALLAIGFDTRSGPAAALGEPADCWSLAVSADPPVEGSVDVSPSPNCGGLYADGTEVTLTANAQPGHHFYYWEDGCSGTDNPAQVTLHADTACTADFGLTPQVDVAVTKVDNKGGSSITGATGSAIPGSSVTYTIVVSNNGPSTATNVAVSDPLPTGVTSFTWSGNGKTNQSGALTDTIASLAPGASVTYTVVAAIDASSTGDLTNVASVSAANDTNPDNNSATDTDHLLTVHASGTSDLSKVADPEFIQTAVQNTSSVPIFLQSVNDSLLGNLIGAGNVTATIAPLVGPIQTVTLATGLELPAGATLTVTATRTVQAADPDPTTGGTTYVFNATQGGALASTGQTLSKSPTWLVNLFQPSLTVSLAADKSAARPGDTVTYTGSITNTSSADTPDLVLTDTNYSATVPVFTLPAGLDLASGAHFNFMYSHVVMVGDPSSLVNTVVVHFHVTPTGLHTGADAYSNDIVGTSPTVTTLTPPLDHFECYDVGNAHDVKQGVTLSDQFGSSGVLVHQAVEFCNPVQKTDNRGGGGPSSITNPNGHLTFYKFDHDAFEGSNEEPARTVQVQNQFGTQTLKVTEVQFLAVPTEKDSLPTPCAGTAPDPTCTLSHFWCYQATGNPVFTTVNLEDQFRTLNVALGSPALLCNPVQKVHGAQTFAILNTQGLLCYNITRQGFKQNIKIVNQFETNNKLAVKADRFLCVPSQTISVTPSPDVTVAKTGNGPISAGDTAEFNVTTSNLGPGQAAGVTMTDPLPTVHNSVGWSIDPGTSDSGSLAACTLTPAAPQPQTLTCNYGSVAPGSGFTIEVQTTTQSSDCGTLHNTASVSASNESPAARGNNTASASITVLCPDVRVAKTGNGPIDNDNTAEFSVTTSNLGPGQAAGVTMPDTLPTVHNPAGWAIDTVTSDSGSLAACTLTPAASQPQTLTCNYGSVAPGSGFTIEVQATTQPADCGTLHNTASVSASNEPPAAGGNNTASASITVICVG